MATDSTDKTPKARSGKVGDVIDVAEGSEVVRPDGSRRNIAGGSYVLDVVGTFEIDGAEVNVK